MLTEAPFGVLLLTSAPFPRARWWTVSLTQVTRPPGQGQALPACRRAAG